MQEQDSQYDATVAFLRKGFQFLWWFLLHSHSLRKYKGIHKGEDCFLIGNGPSLNRMDLDQLCDYYTFGLNKIYLLFDRGSFRPHYHVAVNPYVVQQSVKEFEQLECPSFLSYQASRKVIRKLDHINFLFSGGRLNFSDNIATMINEGWTVTYVALQIAYYMGFERVYLVGVDHSFQVKGDPNELQVLKGKDVNHFDPNYFANKEWHLPDLEGSELSYRLAKFFFERSGRQIYDATIDGHLQIFPKISFEEALRNCKKKK